MNCRIIQIENYYKGQILVPVMRNDDYENKNEEFEWYDIYDGEKYANSFSAKHALRLYVETVVRKPHIIEEFEL